MRRSGPTAVAALLLLATLPAQPPEGEVLRKRAQDAQRAKQYSEAADLYAQLVEKEPGELRWVLEATDCMLRAGRFNAMDLFLDVGKITRQNRRRHQRGGSMQIGKQGRCGHETSEG